MEKEIFTREEVDSIVHEERKQERERILELIDELVEKGKKCPDCRREEYKCIEAHSLLELKNVITAK